MFEGADPAWVLPASSRGVLRAGPDPIALRDAFVRARDEVEAALDDTNLRRLITLFAQLREKSQLIVITHQKPTMEVADALYGVSMRGDGITTVISQRMRGVNMPVGQQEDTSQ